MSNLVPEKRMNVNGHLVTKHVRAVDHDPLNRKKFDIPPVSQLKAYYSDEFGSAFTSASAIAEMIYSFDEDDQMLDASGNPIHEYGHEEARDALVDLFRSETLLNLHRKLEGLPEGRLKELLAHQVYEDISIACETKQRGDEVFAASRIALASVNDGIELAPFADDFAEPNIEQSKITESMYSASRSVRRNCKTEEWKTVLTSDDDYRQMIESEFVIHLITGRHLESEGEKPPAEIYQHHMEVLKNAPRIKKHQAIFVERGEISIDMLDDLDNNSFAIREGTL